MGQTINGMTSAPAYDLDLRTADNTATMAVGLFTGKFDATNR
jgi:hypothetical protein